VNSIDIGTLKDVNELCPFSEVKYEGRYHDTIEYVIHLTKRYLTVDKHRKDKLLFLPALPKKGKDSLLFVYLLVEMGLLHLVQHFSYPLLIAVKG